MEMLPQNPAILPVALVVVLALLGWGLYPVARLSYTEQRKRDHLVQQLTALRARNSTLKQQVDRLKTPAGVEEAARQLGLARKGEQVWVTTPENGRQSESASGAAVVQSGMAPETGWTRTLDALFGVKE
jgi:cell division protein FtsB